VPGAFPAQVAGGFYPGDPTELRREVEGYLSDAASKAPLEGRDIVGILSPHAGYQYSGPVAGEAFRALRGRGYRTVDIMALSHRRRAAKAAVLDRPAYDTPLGSAPIDTSLVRELLSGHGDLFSSDEALFEGEHSLEVQIPFVQVALPGARIVPMILAVEDPGAARRVGEVLHGVLGARSDVVFVASSDLSHHFPYEEAKGYDEANLSLLERWSIDEWIASASRSREGMCGVRPVLALVGILERYPAAARKVIRIDYRNSGDTAGDRASVVGYGALAFTVEEGMRNERGSAAEFGPYGAEQRQRLMELAKAAVAAAAKGEPAPSTEWADGLLKDRGAAFVTLKKRGELRGCIGHVIARVPLVECVADVARSAAIHDTRFAPVTPEELPDLSFEISVLTAPEPIRPEDVVVGVHGLIMSRGGRSGLLLPQVPVEWEWTREEFLAHTCRKAGLPMDCWKDPATEIKGFKAIVWGEDDLVD
jgi:AmmeMemoRadiSam system protein B/AmmeMemoRadiSam system protein A